MTYANIANESIGTTIQTGIKGVAQIGTQTVDKTLDSTSGNVELIALGVMFAILAFVIGYAVKTKNHAGKLF